MSYQRIQHTHSPVAPNTSISSHWQSDDSVTHCNTCDIQFTTFKRKSHCRNCGLIICNTCSQSRWLLPDKGYSDSAVRVCIECNTDLLSQQRGIDIDAIDTQLQQYLDTLNNDELYYTSPQYRKHQFNDKLNDISIELQSLEQQRSSYVDDNELHIQQLNQLAQIAAQTHDQLVELRKSAAHIATVVLPNGDDTVLTRSTSKLHQRYVVVTTQPQSCIALTGLIHKNHTHKRDKLRYYCIYSTAELHSVHGHTKPLNKLYSHITHSYITLMYQQYASAMQYDQSTNTNEHRRSQSSLSHPLSTDLIVIEPHSQRISNTANHSIHEQDELVQTLLYHLHKYQANVQLQSKLIDHAYNDMYETVTWSDQSHIAMLQQLWSGSFGTEQVMPIGKCESWKLLGFQGSDPLTDFRGCGLLALNVLVGISEQRPQLWQKLIQLQSKRHYPLCCVIINLINMVVEILRFHNNTYDKPLSNNALFRLLCRTDTTQQKYSLIYLVTCLLALIDYHCMEHNYTYMEFPKAMQYVKQRLHSLLLIQPIDLHAALKMLVQDTAWSNFALTNNNVDISTV